MATHKVRAVRIRDVLVFLSELTLIRFILPIVYFKYHIVLQSGKHGTVQKGNNTDSGKLEMQQLIQKESPQLLDVIPVSGGVNRTTCLSRKC